MELCWGVLLPKAWFGGRVTGRDRSRVTSTGLVLPLLKSTVIFAALWGPGLV